jgi:hypothetical protein
MKKIDKVELMIWLVGAVVTIALVGLFVYSCVIGAEIETDTVITNANTAVGVAVRTIIF